ncbi:MAG: hypothetical protein OFPII_44010 [Osedax symbiont Rs1]|nr:MAG: hypothetical protein OFPII_44010 [Osedax symbiont Rs1]
MSDKLQNTIMSEKTDDIRVLSEINTIFGIPSKYFIPAILASAGFVFGVNWIFGIAFGFFIITGLHRLHMDDPEGLLAWITRLSTRHKNFVGGQKTGLRIILIK